MNNIVSKWSPSLGPLRGYAFLVKDVDAEWFATPGTNMYISFFGTTMSLIVKY